VRFRGAKIIDCLKGEFLKNLLHVRFTVGETFKSMHFITTRSRFMTEAANEETKPKVVKKTVKRK
jgi:hypothetical protein